MSTAFGTMNPPTFVFPQSSRIAEKMESFYFSSILKLALTIKPMYEGRNFDPAGSHLFSCGQTLTSIRC